MPKKGKMGPVLAGSLSSNKYPVTFFHFVKMFTIYLPPYKNKTQPSGGVWQNSFAG
jgi:hypothetical protein